MTTFIWVLFIISWLVCGCSLETIFEGPPNVAATVISLLVASACIVVINSRWR